jgi:hypothetical protein
MRNYQHSTLGPVSTLTYYEPKSRLQIFIGSSTGITAATTSARSVEGREEREGVGRNPLERSVGEGECVCARVY